MGTEIELKLVAERKALERLLEAPAIAARAAGPAVTQSLESTYFDTGDQGLRGQDMALRVRRIDGRFVQTLKAGGGTVRGEWESEVESLAPDPEALAAQGGNGLDGVRAADLLPLFATRIERRSRELAVTDGGGWPARIEVALDVGAIEAGGRREELAELELELKEGAPSALYRLALELQEIAPLRLETLSKAARGYLLADGAAPPYRKAARLELSADVRVEDAMGGIFGACLEHFQANLATARDGREVEGVHQLRVALRRLRSAFSTFKEVLPEARVAAFKDEVRWVLQSLGPARDLDVMKQELLAPVVDRRPDDAGLRALVRATERARVRAYAAVHEALDMPRTTRFQLELAAWIADKGWREGVDEAVREAQTAPLPGFARQLLDERFKVARRKGRDLSKLSPEERHKLRIALKKLRYAAEFFRGLYDRKEARRALKTLSTLQDELGALNDLRTAEALMDEVAPSRPGRGRGQAAVAALAHAKGLVIGWHGARAAAGEAAAAERWRRFAKARPFWRDAG